MDLGEVLHSPDTVKSYGAVGIEALQAAGLAPSGWSVASMSVLQLLPIAVWAYMVTNVIEYAASPLTSEKKYGWYQPAYSRQQPGGDVIDVESGVGRWPTMGIRADVMAELTGLELWYPLFRAIDTYHTGGAFHHFLALPDSIIYDASGRLRSAGATLPAGNYWVVDPVVALTPSQDGDASRAGWAHSRALAQYRYEDVGEQLDGQVANRRPTVPGDWSGALTGRMADVAVAVEQGLQIEQHGPVPGSPGGGRRGGDDNEQRISAGAVALTLAGWLFFGR